MRIHLYVPPPSFSGYVCYLESVGRYAGIPQHAENRPSGQFPYYNVHFIFSGKGYIKVGGDWVELTEGMGFLYAPYTEQLYKSDKDDPWDIRWIHMDGDLERWLGDKGKKEGWAFSCEDTDRIASLSDELCRLADPFANRHEIRLSAILYELVVHLSREAKSLIGPPPLYRQREKIRNAADYVRTHCQEEWKLERMAKLADYSPYYFNRLFHETMGKTPVQFVTESRITLAKKLLVSSAFSVKRIALESGFAAPHYFVAQFRKQEGMTPLQYRRMYGNEVPMHRNPQMENIKDA